MDESFVERVLDLVERIPPGQVLSYGRIAEHLADGYGPRYVGRIMAHAGGGVPWWRVVRSDGGLPPSHLAGALSHYRDEGTPLRPGGDKVDMRRALWVIE